MPIEKVSVIYQRIDQLKPNPHNARTHAKHQIRQIAESIRIFGLTNPALVDAENQIIAGHGRVEAAKLLGMQEVPTIRLDRLTREQIRAYVIADNKLAENAGWDKEILAIEFETLLALECADFDVTITGFEIPEIDLILEEAKSASFLEEGSPEPNFNQDPVTEPDDLWLLGKHRVNGVLTGRGADIIILDDILKPDDALSETRHRAANEWYFNTLLSRLNSKENGIIIIVAIIYLTFHKFGPIFESWKRQRLSETRRSGSQISSIAVVSWYNYAGLTVL